MHAMAEEKSRLNVTRSSCKVADLLQIPFIDLNQFMNGLPPSIVNKEDLKIKRSRSNIL